MYTPTSLATLTIFLASISASPIQNDLNERAPVKVTLWSNTYMTGVASDIYVEPQTGCGMWKFFGKIHEHY